MAVVSISSIPRDVLFEIANYLSPKEKRVASYVCEAFRDLFEHPRVLSDRFSKETGDKFSIRQLSILLNSSTSNNDLMSIALDCLLERISSRLRISYPAISEKSFTRVLEIAKNIYVPANEFFYIKTLVVFDRCFNKSSGYKKERAIDLLYDCITNTKGFSPDQKTDCKSPISKAARHNSENLIRAFVKAGANVNPSPNKKKPFDSPLYQSSDFDSSIATKTDQINTLRALLEKGAIPERNNGEAFFKVVLQANEDAARVFCEFKASVSNIVRDYPITPTPLFCALQYTPSLSMVKILVENGADPTIPNHHKTTPAGIARIYHLNDIADYLDQEIERRKKL